LPKKTVEIILSTGNNYVLEVKGNQPKLLEQLKENISKNTPIDSFSTEEKSRGRRENRYHEIYTQTNGINSEWKGVQRIIYVHRFGYRPDKKSNEGKYSEKHYYITGYAFDSAKTVAQGIRGHWGIENKIHYVKDTHFNEDKNRIKHNHAAANLSIIQDIAINIYRCLGFSSMKTATTFFANKVNELFMFISAKHISDL